MDVYIWFEMLASFQEYSDLIVIYHSCDNLLLVSFYTKYQFTLQFQFCLGDQEGGEIFTMSALAKKLWSISFISNKEQILF